MSIPRPRVEQSTHDEAIATDRNGQESARQINAGSCKFIQREYIELVAIIPVSYHPLVIIFSGAAPSVTCHRPASAADLYFLDNMRHKVTASMKTSEAFFSCCNQRRTMANTSHGTPRELLPAISALDSNKIRSMYFLNFDPLERGNDLTNLIYYSLITADQLLRRLKTATDQEPQ
jgi:hypothetical protein